MKVVAILGLGFSLRFRLAMVDTKQTPSKNTFKDGWVTIQFLC